MGTYRCGVGWVGVVMAVCARARLIVVMVVILFRIYVPPVVS